MSKRARSQVIACLASAPRHLGCRDRFIGWNPEARRRNVHLLAYNTRFLILPWVRGARGSSGLAYSGPDGEAGGARLANLVRTSCLFAGNLHRSGALQGKYRDSVFEEIDTGAILARHPQVCVVDEFPHTNVPGSERLKRWEDVEILRAAGIDVLTTMNIQHLESLNDQIWQISGIRVRETVPDWVVQQADEVVMVDLTPRALLNRLQRGVVYEKEKAERALQNFFREQTLVALRELALRQAAHEVEHRMLEEETSPDGTSVAPRKQHKILVFVTADPKTAMVIRRAKRVSDFLSAECFAVAVQPSGDLTGLPAVDRDAVERHLNFARNLRIETRILEGNDIASTLVDFGRRNRVTQIFLTRPSRKAWSPALSRDPVQRVIDLAKDMQIVIVSDREPVRQ